MTQTEVKRKEELRKKYLIYGIGAGALLGGGYLLFNYLQDRQILKRGNQSLTVNNILPNLPKPSPSRPRSGFPLRRGSKGSLVSQLQAALYKRGGQAANIIKATSMKPNGAFDGGFGPGTEKALRAAGLATTISRQLFDQITATNTSSGNAANHQVIARELTGAAQSKNLFATLAALRKMNSKIDYIAVKGAMGNVRVNGVRVSSPVNALLSVAFRSNEPAKVKIRAEFRRMGLRQNARGIWTLSGFNELAIIPSEVFNNTDQTFDLVVADKPTMLKNGEGDYLLPTIQPNTLIGYLTGHTNGVAQVLTENGMTVYAPSQNLKTL